MKLWLFLCTAITLCHAQGQDTTRILKKDAVVKKNLGYYFAPISIKHVAKSKKIDFQIDTRNSFVKDFPINVYGLNLGVVVHERFRMGAGYYWINQNFNNKLLGIYTAADGAAKEGRVIVGSKGVPVPVTSLQKLVDAGKLNSFISGSQQLDLWFASLGFMYSFYVSRLVEFALPIEVGYGNFSEKLYDVSGNDFSSLGAGLKPGTTSGSFLPGQVGLDLLIKPHRWVYLEGTIGYRQTLAQNYSSKYRATSFDSRFNGEYYNIGVKVQIGTIYKEWKHRKKNKTELSIKE
ncbi:MAG: hypothetical protein JST48_03815 [Bacteroidetes bacterium]|nr:hypothetical protein [Bacteroidota bacterium]